MLEDLLLIEFNKLWITNACSIKAKLLTAQIFPQKEKKLCAISHELRSAISCLKTDLGQRHLEVISFSREACVYQGIFFCFFYLHLRFWYQLNKNVCCHHIISVWQAVIALLQTSNGPWVCYLPRFGRWARADSLNISITQCNVKSRQIVSPRQFRFTLQGQITR